MLPVSLTSSTMLLSWTTISEALGHRLSAPTHPWTIPAHQATNSKAQLSQLSMHGQQRVSQPINCCLVSHRTDMDSMLIRMSPSITLRRNLRCYRCLQPMRATRSPLEQGLLLLIHLSRLVSRSSAIHGTCTNSLGLTSVETLLRGAIPASSTSGG